MRLKTHYIDAVCQEIKLQRDYLQTPVKTIYFGGGTPSQLTGADLSKMKDALFDENELDLKEVTLEVNPDDIHPDYLESINTFLQNRFSIGVQSFDDQELLFLNRRHNAKTAIRAVNECYAAGYRNISIDLIYGLPGQQLKTLRKTLRQALDLPVTHISAYHLTYEKGTKLHRLLQSGQITPVDDEQSILLYEEIIDLLENAGFAQYEISNFAAEGFQSRHNSAYWNGNHYLGIGASAHSYNGKTRQWNVSSVEAYIQAINRGEIPAEVEKIDPRTAYNDYIITRLRTRQGIDLTEIAELFDEMATNYCMMQIKKHLSNGLMEEKSPRFSLTRKGIFVADCIMRDLLLI
jgi:oxygen-independent coproporphyrinogen-3 oxidase